MFEQGVVAKKLELAETMGLFSFFQNIANAVSWRRDTKFDYLKPTWLPRRVLHNTRITQVA